METFTQILEKWFACFDRMKVGDRIEIEKYANGDIVLFTDMCKYYIDSHMNYELTNDYKALIKIQA